jgi:hypothetical protein
MKKKKDEPRPCPRLSVLIPSKMGYNVAMRGTVVVSAGKDGNNITKIYKLWGAQQPLGLLPIVVVW